MKRTVAALLLVGILAGCSGGATPAAVAVAPSAAPTVATTTPTPFKPVALPGCGCGGSAPSWDFRRAPSLLGAGFWAAP